MNHFKAVENNCRNIRLDPEPVGSKKFGSLTPWLTIWSYI